MRRRDLAWILVLFAAEASVGCLAGWVLGLGPEPSELWRNPVHQAPAGLVAAAGSWESPAGLAATNAAASPTTGRPARVVAPDEPGPGMAIEAPEVPPAPPTAGPQPPAPMLATPERRQPVTPEEPPPPADPVPNPVLEDGTAQTLTPRNEPRGEILASVADTAEIAVAVVAGGIIQPAREAVFGLGLLGGL